MITNKKVLAVTLARGGSVRIPRKNIVDLNGSPLIKYTIDEVKKSKYIDNYYVSTEDSEIACICKMLGAQVHNRPIELAKNTSTTAEALLDIVIKNN